MSAEVKKEIELEIAYVLFIDIVGYSKLVTSEQRRSLELLNEIVRGADNFRAAEANGRLLIVPSGDGMALVFYNTPEAPVECALEISSAAREHPSLKLRMGIHSGPVSGVVDVKRPSQHRRRRHQHRAAGNGLRRRRPHSASRNIWPKISKQYRPLAVVSARSGRVSRRSTEVTRFSG